MTKAILNVLDVYDLTYRASGYKTFQNVSWYQLTCGFIFKLFRIFKKDYFKWAL